MAQERDAKKKLKEDLAHLRDYVQSVVETQATSRDAAALIESAFMSVRKTHQASKAELSAKNTGVSGTVVLDAKAVARAATYYWQYLLGSLQFFPVGFITTVDIFPGAPDNERVQVSLMGRLLL